MSFIYNLADTWNNGATAFTSIKLIATDTAFAAGTLLIDLRTLSGGSQFSVSNVGAGILASLALGGATIGTDALGITGTATISGIITAGSHVFATGALRAGATQGILWNTRSALNSPSDGTIIISDNAGSSFSMLKFGAATSAYPAIKRNSAALNFRLADDSADAAITAGNATFSGTIIAVANLPTADPHVAGRLYSTASAVMISTG